MALKKIQELKGNEVLERDIMTWDYQIILPKGAIIKVEYIDRLKELGIAEVYVNESERKDGEIYILKQEMEESIKESVKNILERHTYQNNSELAELSATANEIIANILEEEKVIEKVFDIKERSADIYEHSINLCSLSTLTALKLGVDIKRVHDIGVACLLHDIGLRYMTINYDNRDINSLSKQELVEYKKHPVYGYSSLKDEKWISNLSKAIILYHHEKIDGSGFPLKIKEIPYECKIVNVCETFDEMISGIACERTKVYEAVEYLKSFKNIYFDPIIVDTLLSFTAVYPSGSHVMTNEGEVGVVISQNKEFIDRPIIRIIKDKYGNDVKQEIIKNLIEIHNIFIEKVID